MLTTRQLSDDLIEYFTGNELSVELAKALQVVQAQLVKDIEENAEAVRRAFRGKYVMEENA